MTEHENEDIKPIGIEILRVVIFQWKTILIMVGAAAIASVVFTLPLFIAPVFKAETVIYPASSNTSITLLNSEMRFGFESDLNTQVQILHSTILRDSLIKKYNLFKHYEIDTESTKKNYYLYKEYDEDVEIERSRYNSVIIDVYDKDPAMAASMANDIVKIGDHVKSEIIKRNLRTVFAIASRELNAKIKDISELGDSINYLKHKNYNEAIALQSGHYLSQKNTVDELRNSIVKIRNDEGVYDLDNQFNSIYKSYLKANSTYLTDSGMVAVMQKRFKENDTALIKREAELEGARMLTKQMKYKLDRLNQSGKKYNALFDAYSFEKGILGGLKSEYEIATSTYEKEFGNLRLETLKNKYSSELQVYNVLKTKYELALSNLTDQVPASYVVSPAEKPSRKDFPNVLLITALVCGGILILSIAFFMASGFFKKLLTQLKP